MSSAGQDPRHLQSPVFDQLPIGLIVTREPFLIVEANAFSARQLGIQVGDALDQRVHPDSTSQFRDAAGRPGTEVQVQFTVPGGTLYVQLQCVVQQDVRLFTLRDISEQVALSTQLLKDREPERKLIHEISNALTTAMGYTELINMMLDENDALGGERLAAVKRYEKEVYRGLQRADAVLRSRRTGSTREQGAIPLKPKHVMVVDDEQQIAEYLSELLRGRHYKVSSFTDSSKALVFFHENHAEIDLVIMDQVMPQMSGMVLATELRAHNAELPIVLCTGDQRGELGSDDLKFRHILSKPIDINELTRTVSAIIG